MTEKEPVGSVGPRLVSGNDIKVITADGNSSVTMVCPAQAYPVPIYRYENGETNIIN